MEAAGGPWTVYPGLGMMLRQELLGDPRPLTKDSQTESTRAPLLLVRGTLGLTGAHLTATSYWQVCTASHQVAPPAPSSEAPGWQNPGSPKGHQ